MDMSAKNASENIGQSLKVLKIAKREHSSDYYLILTQHSKSEAGE